MADGGGGSGPTLRSEAAEALGGSPEEMDQRRKEAKRKRDLLYLYGKVVGTNSSKEQIKVGPPPFGVLKVVASFLLLLDKRTPQECTSDI